MRQPTVSFSLTGSDAWLLFDTFRAGRERLGGWPDHVFCPVAGAQAIVAASPTYRGTSPHDLASEIAWLSALGAWRPTQGIYRFAPALLDALWSTPVTGDLPVEVLHRLPEWCVYLELGKEVDGAEI